MAKEGNKVHEAILNHDLSKLQQCFTSEKEAGSYDGLPVLHLASKLGYADMVKFLLTSGCPIESKDSCGRKPLQLAVNYSQSEVVDVLLSHGAQVYGTASLDAAMRADIDIVRILSAKNGSNFLSKQFTQKSICYILGVVGSSNAIDLFIEQGFNVNTKDFVGRTALHGACTHGMEKTAEALIRHKADVVAKDCRGYTPLHCAASYGASESIIRLLLENGACIEEGVSSKIGTPLHVACNCGQRSAVRTLAAFGASVNAKNSSGETPLFSIIRETALPSYFVYESLINASLRELWMSTLIVILVQNGADVNHKNPHGMSCLDVAVSLNQIEAAAMLLVAGADVTNNIMMALVGLEHKLPNFYRKVMKHLSTVPSLMDLARRTTCRSLQIWPRVAAVPCLPLPKTLTDYLMYNDLNPI